MTKATITDVASLAGVSIKTVSRVVNDEPNVSNETRSKVERAIGKLDYRPNQSARNLASLRSHLIGLIYDDPSAYENPSSGYVIRIQQGALRACRQSNYELLIHPCNYRSAGISQELRALISQARPDGIVLAAPLSNMLRIVRTIEDSGIPFVRMSSGAQRGHHCSVATNDREICSEMTQYLASLGHRRIAFITGHTSHKAVQNRFRGYQDGLRASGISVSSRLVMNGDNSFDSGEHCALKLLNRAQRPTAIFAANDDMAAGVIRAADRLGIRIPDQLSVCGCDDNSLARQIYPALTTIRQPLAAMAERATLQLIECKRSGERPRGISLIPARMVVRESTGPAPA